LTEFDQATTLVVIPTYQERDNIEDILRRVLSATAQTHVLVVDDGSPDGTGKAADVIADDNPRVHVLHRAAKAGLGAAYIAGFDWAMSRSIGYQVLVEMDADGSHAPEQLPRLLQALADADVVLGSRWIPGGSVVNWPRRREVLSRGGNIYIRLALGVEVHDATGGFRAYRRAVLEAIDYGAVAAQGYCFQVDLVRRALAAGFRVTEVPITFVERVRGESKMSGEIVREALWRVTQWGAQHRGAQLRERIRGFVGRAPSSSGRE
jgi:dolichol-phosphate mannosyltransferase